VTEVTNRNVHTVRRLCDGHMTSGGIYWKVLYTEICKAEILHFMKANVA